MPDPGRATGLAAALEHWREDFDDRVPDVHLDPRFPRRGRSGAERYSHSRDPGRFAEVLARVPGTRPCRMDDNGACDAGPREFVVFASPVGFGDGTAEVELDIYFVFRRGGMWGGEGYLYRLEGAGADWRVTGVTRTNGRGQ